MLLGDFTNTQKLGPIKVKWLEGEEVRSVGMDNFGGNSTLILILLCLLSSCSYKTSHLDHQYLSVPSFHSSLHESIIHFGNSFAFDTPKSWNYVQDNVCNATTIAYFRKKFTTCLFKNAIHLSHPATPVFSLA